MREQDIIGYGWEPVNGGMTAFENPDENKVALIMPEYNIIANKISYATEVLPMKSEEWSIVCVDNSTEEVIYRETANDKSTAYMILQKYLEDNPIE